MKTLVEVNKEWAGKAAIIEAIYREAGSDIDMDKVKALNGDSATKVAELQRMHRELDEIGKERDVLLALDGQRKVLDRELNAAPDRSLVFPGNGGRMNGEQRKSLGQLFVESIAYKEFRGRGGPAALLDAELKTVLSTGAGWDPEIIRIPRVELSAQRPISVVNFLPQFLTNRDTIAYMKETTFTSTNVVEKAEQTATTAADVIGEAALALTQTTDEVEWLPAFLPVTIQQMEDVEGIQDYVNQRLSYMLQARLDLQIIQGTGVSPLLLGTNALASVLSQAKGSDPTPDAIFKGMRQVRATGFAEPSVVFVHPNDWQDIRLLRTADGIYIFGSPMDAGVERIWGVPVVQTTAALENTITLGDYARFSGLFTKRGITIAVSDSHSHYFTRGLLAIRADMRVAVVHFRDTAFCKITGV